MGRAAASPGSLKAFSDVAASSDSLGLLDDAKGRAARLGISFRSYPLVAEDDVLVCEAMASRAAVVAVDGGVYPCIYLSLPVDPIARVFRGERGEVSRRSFGNIADADMRSIWESGEFRSFRRAFELRRGLATHLFMDQAIHGSSARARSPVGLGRFGE